MFMYPHTFTRGQMGLGAASAMLMLGAVRERRGALPVFRATRRASAMRDVPEPDLQRQPLAVHLTLWGACALYLEVPLLVMLLTSFKTPDDIRAANLLSLPDTFTVIGWLKAWDSVGAFFWNSVLITVPGVLISTVIGALNGYVLSMWRFPPFPAVLRRAVVHAASCRSQVILLPMSFTSASFGLANTTSGLVLVHVIYGAGLHHAVLPQLFRGDPRMAWSRPRAWTAPVSSPSSCASCCRCPRPS